MYWIILHRHPNFTNKNHSMPNCCAPGTHCSHSNWSIICVFYLLIRPWHNLYSDPTIHSYSSNITKNKILTPILVPLRSRILSLVVRVLTLYLHKTNQERELYNSTYQTPFPNPKSSKIGSRTQWPFKMKGYKFTFNIVYNTLNNTVS